MRLFIAIDVPRELKKRIRDQISRHCDYQGCKLVELENLHITLKFLGEVSPSLLDQIIEDLSTIQWNKFQLTCSGLGYFPLRSLFPRVLWMGVTPVAPCQTLRTLIDKVGEHWKVEKKETECNFHPHLTIARFKPYFWKNRQPHEFLGEIHHIFNESFDVEKFFLISSNLTNQGPIYKILASFPSQ